MTENECSICHYRFKTPDEARACEAQGVEETIVRIGDMFSVPFAGGLLFRVNRFVTPSMLSHKPGVEAELIQGDMSALFVGDGTGGNSDMPQVQWFDEATVLRYLIVNKTDAS